MKTFKPLQAHQHITIKQNEDIKYEDSKVRDLTLFSVSGDDNAKDVFEFLGDNYTKDAERPLEWTHAQIGTEESGRNIVGTTHLKSATSVGHYLRKEGYTLREVNHNHPSGSRPSFPKNGRLGDVGSASYYEKDFPNIELNVYIGDGVYLQYTSKSKKSDFIFFNLPCINIVP